MSTGQVVCSACGLQLHQDGNKGVEKGWRHDDDARSPRCAGATAEYPRTAAQAWCEMPGCARRAVKSVPGTARFETRWVCDRIHDAAPLTLWMSKKLGRNYPCSCGSGKKYKKCCAALAPEQPPATGGEETT